MTFPQHRTDIPERPVLDGLEEKWSGRWDEQRVYVFDAGRATARERVFSIDTPPFTADGLPHTGHIMSYTRTDTVARFQRMRGKEVFHPIGWDDAGPAGELRAQHHFGVRCDPALPYDPSATPPAEPGKDPLPVSRRTFTELCDRLRAQDEQAGARVWRRIGLSVDWTRAYRTSAVAARAAVQLAFLRDLARGAAYRAAPPAAGDPAVRTAVTQAERGGPRPLTRAAQVHGEGAWPPEPVTTGQWYLPTVGRDTEVHARLLRCGTGLAWHPPHLRARYEKRFGGAGGDRLISSRRCSGVPVPLWYPLDADGRPDHERPLVPGEAALPVDPGTEAPPGYTEEQRGEPGGFGGELGVLDTWAASSLIPQIEGGGHGAPDLHALLFPMDLRPETHEVLSTALFDAVLRSHAGHGTPPWRHVVVSGRVLHPILTKWDASHGRVTPTELLDWYGPDAVRYWAAVARPGKDIVVDRSRLEIGRRRATKLLNIGRFVLGLDDGALEAGPEANTAAVTEPLDRALLTELAAVVADVTEAFEEFDPARALARSEPFLRRFCNDYVELVKPRAYGELDGGVRGGPARSARAALRMALDTLLRLFAPVLSFAAEEVWSWWRDGSVHRAGWPDAAALARAGHGTDGEVLETAADAIAAVRRAKSAARLSLRAPLASAVVTASRPDLNRFEIVASDVRAAGRIGAVEQIVATDGTGQGGRSGARHGQGRERAAGARGAKGRGLTVEVRL